MSLPFYAVVMAGGSGSRLWPLSRKNRPKQVLDLAGDGQSMFQIAIKRLLPIMPAAHILVVTTADLVAQLAAQTPDIPMPNFIVEPEGRGTAPVIGLGAIYAEYLAGGPATIACLTADHHIEHVSRFQAVLQAAAQVAETGEIVTLGIKPSYAATGFGYIEQDSALQTVGEFEVYRAKAFKEKPSAQLAQQFLADGQHTWNSGMFIWTTERVRAEFVRQLPETSAKLDQIKAALGTPGAADCIAQVWPTIPKQTIDYGIIEGAARVATIPVDIGWSDVGSWASLLEIMAVNDAGNVVLGGQHLAIDTSGSLVFSDRLVATVGLKDMIVVNTPDALLICPANRAQEVRQIVAQLETQEDMQPYL